MSSEELAEFIEVLDLVLSEKSEYRLVLEYEGKYSISDYSFTYEIRTDGVRFRLVERGFIFLTQYLSFNQLSRFSSDDYSLVKHVADSILLGIESDTKSSDNSDSGVVFDMSDIPGHEDSYLTFNGTEWVMFNGSDWVEVPEKKSEEELIDEWFDES